MDLARSIPVRKLRGSSDQADFQRLFGPFCERDELFLSSGAADRCHPPFAQARQHALRRRKGPVQQMH